MCGSNIRTDQNEPPTNSMGLIDIRPEVFGVHPGAYMLLFFIYYLPAEKKGIHDVWVVGAFVWFKIYQVSRINKMGLSKQQVSRRDWRTLHCCRSGTINTVVHPSVYLNMLGRLPKNTVFVFNTKRCGFHDVLFKKDFFLIAQPSIHKVWMRVESWSFTENYITRTRFTINYYLSS